ncbi:DUF5959 family protein [Streptomyces sp. NPDC024089]|uniref:DUF5959 family protein n=1 Tax=Streptomyces sp. NPDC024089 TaxID=3154328 RepID=UPI0033D66DBE
MKDGPRSGEDRSALADERAAVEDSPPSKLISLADDEGNSVSVDVLGRSPRWTAGLDSEIVVKTPVVSGRVDLALYDARLESWADALDQLDAGDDVAWMEMNSGPSPRLRNPGCPLRSRDPPRHDRPHGPPPHRPRAANRRLGRSHIPFLAESAVLWEALGPELYEAVLAVHRAEAELFPMFTDAEVIEAVHWQY